MLLGKMLLVLFLNLCVLSVALAQGPANYFYLQPQDRSFNAKLFDHPSLQGVVLRRSDYMLNAAGFEPLVADLMAAKMAGHKVLLRVINGAYIRDVDKLWTLQDKSKRYPTGVPLIVPCPWDPVYLSVLDEAVRELASHTRGQCEYVQVTGIGRAGEMHTAGAMRNAQGASEESMVFAMRTICRSYRQHFGAGQQFVVGLSPVFGGDLPLMNRLWATAQEELPLVLPMFHSLKADANMAWGPRGVCLASPRYGSEQISPSANRGRYGGSFQASLELIPGTEFLCVYPGDITRIPDQ